MTSLLIPTLLILIFSLAIPSQFAQELQFGKKFVGDGTYYGSTEGGHCSIRLPRPNMYSAWQPVAINSAQYANSLACGACIEYEGKGEGSGANPIAGKKVGYIMDECPSCAYGDIDLSKSGDGRWKVSWKFIPCPASSRVDFLFEGSNSWYTKCQPRGTRSPVKSMSINGVQGKRSIDNFFVFGSGWMGRSAVADITTALGERLSVTIPYFVSDGVVTGAGGSSQSGRSGSRGPARKPSPPRRKSPPKKRPSPAKRKPKRPSPPRPGRCVPRWRSCSGKRAYRKWRTTKCCGNWQCRWSKKAYRGKRCMPPRRRRKSHGRCVPNWGPCTGPKNRWGTSKCCGDYRCVVPRERTFVGKRCEPK